MSLGLSLKIPLPKSGAIKMSLKRNAVADPRAGMHDFSFVRFPLSVLAS
jgi:hypothetical protein